MKNLLITLVLFPAISFCQTNKANFPTTDSKVFNWKAGNDELKEVKFEYFLDERIEEQLLNKIVVDIMVQSKYSLKNKYSFIPKKLTLIKTEDSYNGVCEYIGQNSFGAEVVTKTYFSFINEGDGKVTKLYSK